MGSPISLVSRCFIGYIKVNPLQIFHLLEEVIRFIIEWRKEVHRENLRQRVSKLNLRMEIAATFFVIILAILFIKKREIWTDAAMSCVELFVLLRFIHDMMSRIELSNELRNS